MRVCELMNRYVCVSERDIDQNEATTSADWLRKEFALCFFIFFVDKYFEREPQGIALL